MNWIDPKEQDKERPIGLPSCWPAIPGAVALMSALMVDTDPSSGHPLRQILLAVAFLLNATSTYQALRADADGDKSREPGGLPRGFLLFALGGMAALSAVWV